MPGLADLGLHFLGENEPVHHYLEFDATGTGEALPCLVQLKGDTWAEHPGQQLLRRVGGLIAWRSRDAWLIAAERIEGSILLRSYHLKGPGAYDIGGPHALLEVPENVRLGKVAASQQGQIAVLVYRADGDRLTGWITSLDDDSAREIVSIPGHPGPSEIDAIVWSPTGELLSVTTDPARDSVAVWALRQGEWRNIAEAEQHTRGRLFGPRLYARPDGTPIVTWEDFYTR